MTETAVATSLFLNRELSWLEFNSRVLHEAEDERTPLLERLKFLSIFSTNLDEFYMVRIAALRRQVAAGVQSQTPDGVHPVIHYLTALVPVPVSEGPLALVGDKPPAWLAITGLLAFAAVLLALTMRRVRTMEVLYGED